MERGYYFVLCEVEFYEDCIVGCDPHVIIAYYYGNGNWDTELLEGEDYKVKPIIIPSVTEMEV